MTHLFDLILQGHQLLPKSLVRTQRPKDNKCCLVFSSTSKSSKQKHAIETIYVIPPQMTPWCGVASGCLENNCGIVWAQKDQWRIMKTCPTIWEYCRKSIPPAVKSAHSQHLPLAGCPGENGQKLRLKGITRTIKLQSHFTIKRRTFNYTAFMYIMTCVSWSCNSVFSNYTPQI